MSLVDYNDYAFSSEDEYHEDGDDIDDGDGDDESQISDQSIDTDEYTIFSTDFEKYRFDQARWIGISNSRQHTQTKKKIKPEDSAEDHPKVRVKVEDESGRDAKPKKQRKTKALPRRSAKGNGKKESLSEPAVKIPNDGEIHFDVRGGLWYSHQNGTLCVSGML